MPPGMVLTKTKVDGFYDSATRYSSTTKPVLAKVAAGTALVDEDRHNL